MEEFNLKRLATRIKAARKVERKTQDEVAEAICVSKNTVSDWERGLKQPGILNILNYCNFLGITIDELLGLQKEPIFWVEFTEEEQQEILAIVEKCKHDLENSPLHDDIHVLEARLLTFFKKAHAR